MWAEILGLFSSLYKAHQDNLGCHPPCAISLSLWMGGKKDLQRGLNHYLHVCGDAGGFSGPGSCFLAVRKELHLSP